MSPNATAPAPGRADRCPTASAVLHDITALVLALALAFLLIGPTGEFPLMDDWSFAAAVRELLDSGSFRPTEWTAMTLLTQVLWGGLFSLLAGFSFETLRFSTVVTALLAAGAGYALLRELGQSRTLCRVFAWTLAFSPLFVVLSLTFMTDVPFVALLLMAAAAWCRYLQTGSMPAWWIALAVSLAAILSRQLAIALPLGFAIGALLQPGLDRRRIAAAIAPVVLGTAGFIVFHRVMSSLGRLPVATDLQAGWLLLALGSIDTVAVVLRHAYVALVYLGVFLLPVLVALVPQLWGDRRRLAAITLTGSVLAIGLLSLLSRTRDGRQAILMPTADNLLVPSGLGPTLLRDQYLLQLDNIPRLPEPFWMVVTAAGMVGASVLLAALASSAWLLFRRWRVRQLVGRDRCALFLLASAAVYVAPLLLTAFFDRYLLPLIPLLAAGIAASSRPRDVSGPPFVARYLPAVLVVAIAAFSIAGSHDYMAWNRLRWQVLDQLMQSRGAGPDAIDGGFEFNGLHRYDPAYVAVEGKSHWWVERDDYLIGFGAVPGFNVIERHNYDSWLWQAPRELVVMQKAVAR